MAAALTATRGVLRSLPEQVKELAAVCASVLREHEERNELLRKENVAFKKEADITMQLAVQESTAALAAEEAQVLRLMEQTHELQRERDQDKATAMAIESYATALAINAANEAVKAQVAVIHAESDATHAEALIHEASQLHSPEQDGQGRAIDAVIETNDALEEKVDELETQLGLMEMELAASELSREHKEKEAHGAGEDNMVLLHNALKEERFKTRALEKAVQDGAEQLAKAHGRTEAFRAAALQATEEVDSLQRQLDSTKPRQARTASVLVDIDGDGVADYRVTGIDRDHDGIPDALQSGASQRIDPTVQYHGLEGRLHRGSTATGSRVDSQWSSSPFQAARECAADIKELVDHLPATASRNVSPGGAAPDRIARTARSPVAHNPYY